MHIKSFLSIAAAFVLTASFADPNSPQAALVSVTQSQSMREVTATYTLDEPAIITFDVKTNGVSIGKENLGEACGDVYRVVQPTEEGKVRTICWAAERACKGKQFAAGSVTFEVVAWATNAPPDYMVVSLIEKKGERSYYTAPEQLPDGGVTNRKYKTDYLVMRKIPAKDVIFPMGYNSSAQYQYCLYHRVKLTNDFYMAVYELTLGQMKNAIGESPDNLTTYYRYVGNYTDKDYSGNPEFAAYASNLANPIPETPYYKFRGYTGSLWGGSFNHEIADSGSYLYQLRNALNIPSLDLPTDAEWEFACRAGTSENRYDGTWSYSVSADAIAWTADNSLRYALWGYSYYLPHEVGLLQPNAFGLYDTLGNVSEMCLDLYNEGTAYTGDAVINDMNAEPIIAPTGPVTDIKGNYDGLSRGSYSNYTKGGLWEEWKSGKGDTNSTRRVARGGNVSYAGWGIMAYYRFPIGSSKCMAECADYDADTRGPYGYRLVCLP